MTILFRLLEVTILKLGAIIIATGDAANPMLPSGGICVTQRMIATLQKAGVPSIVVVTGSDDKKMEKQLAQYGVFFLQNAQPHREDLSVCMSMEYLSGKCDRIYLMQANFPLITPETLLQLKESEGELVAPTYDGKRGQPLLVNGSFDGNLSVASIMACSDLKEVPVDDAGILLSATEANQHKDLLAEHERKLTRLISEFSITRGKPLVDRKLVALLRLIRETQSVRDACNRMQISYSTAWNLLNAAEDALDYPLVSRNKGGPSGSGSLLTEKGQRLLDACDRFETAARANLECLYGQFLESIL